MTNKPVSFPFRSSAAYSRAAELLSRGSWSVRDPHDEENAKPDGFQVEELLWEIGRSQQLRINELLDAHEMIPDIMAPRADTTSGAKTTLAERVQVIRQRMEKAEASLAAVKAERDAMRADQSAARFVRLLGICHKILWTDFGEPAVENDQTAEALSDLCEFLFLDACAALSLDAQGEK